MKIVVAGAGLAGLTFAALMRQRRPSVEVVVLERNPILATRGRPDDVLDFHPAGAISVLASLGVLPAIEAAGVRVAGLLTLDPGGRILMKSAEPVLRTTRSEALTALSAVVGKVEFRTSVRSYEQHEGGVRVTVAGGRFEEADWLVGADGANSLVRQQMLGDRPVYRGRSAIVGLLPIAFDHDLLHLGAFLTLGTEGNSLLVVRHPLGLELSFSERFSEPRTFSDPDVMLRRVRTATRAWHAPIPDLVGMLDPAMLIFRDFFDRPATTRLRDERVWLLADAAQLAMPCQPRHGDLAVIAAHRLAQFFVDGEPDMDPFE